MCGVHLNVRGHSGSRVTERDLPMGTSHWLIGATKRAEHPLFVFTEKRMEDGKTLKQRTAFMIRTIADFVECTTPEAANQLREVAAKLEEGPPPPQTPTPIPTPAPTDPTTAEIRKQLVDLANTLMASAPYNGHRLLWIAKLMDEGMNVAPELLVLSEGLRIQGRPNLAQELRNMAESLKPSTPPAPKHPPEIIGRITEMSQSLQGSSPRQAQQLSALVGTMTGQSSNFDIRQELRAVAEELVPTKLAEATALYTLSRHFEDQSPKLSSKADFIQKLYGLIKKFSPSFPEATARLVEVGVELQDPKMIRTLRKQRAKQLLDKLEELREKRNACIQQYKDEYDLACIQALKVFK
jgi:hypothetical protein